MDALPLISDAELLARMPTVVLAERASSADVIEHLTEIDRRRLYLGAACPSLSAFCMERLGYSEDESAVRVRVTRLARNVPTVIEELRTGKIHLTGLCLLAQVLTPDNAAELLPEARGKSKRAIESIIASRFPKVDVPDRIAREPQQATLAPTGDSATGAAAAESSIRSGPGTELASAARGRVAPLSASSWSVQFTASAELHEKLERAQELLSHAVPNGELAEVFDRALDALIERETKRRLGTGRPRKRRVLGAGSRWIPLEVARTVWERDGGQCTLVDSEGRRCSARRFITFEHVEPFALGGPPTVENLCLRCKAHNIHAARQVFGDAHIDAKCEERRKTRKARGDSQVAVPARAREAKASGADAAEKRGSNEIAGKVHTALRSMGFADGPSRRAVALAAEGRDCVEVETLLRATLALLVPDPAVSIARR